MDISSQKIPIHAKDVRRTIRRFMPVLIGSFIFLLIVVPVVAAPPFSAWGLADSIETIPGTSTSLNTQFIDGCPMLSRDGLTLYLASNREDGTDLDIWYAGRLDTAAPFGDPTIMGPPINSSANDFCPSPLWDGSGFLFVSNRAGGCGGNDIYITRYIPRMGWLEPENLGCDVNSSASDVGPVLVYAEAGPPSLYFSSTRPAELGGSNIYMSLLGQAGSFGEARLVPNVNSASEDMQPFVRRDGLELFFASNRPGGSNGFDIWSASRSTIALDWSTPQNLGQNVNSPYDETRPSLSWNATMLLFGTNRPGFDGASDIFFATRTGVSHVDATYRQWITLVNR